MGRAWGESDVTPHCLGLQDRLVQLSMPQRPAVKHLALPSVACKLHKGSGRDEGGQRAPGRAPGQEGGRIGQFSQEIQRPLPLTS